MPNSFENITITVRHSFIEFITQLQQDYLANKDAWENHTLESFLDAMARYAFDIQGYYNNTGQAINADTPSWAVFADIMKGATVYE